MRKRMESCSIVDSDWDGWELWGNSSYNIDDVFDFSSPIDQSLTLGLEDANNDGGKSNVFAKWMDQKMDLSILDNLEGQPDLLDDLDVMIEDPAALLDNLIDWSSEILGNESDILNSKPEKIIDVVKEALPASGFAATPDSPGGKVPDNSIALSPERQQESFYVNSFNPKNLFVTPTEETKSGNIDPLSYQFVKESSSVDAPELSNFKNSQLSPSSSVTSIETVDSNDDDANIESSCSSPAADTPIIKNDSVIFVFENNSLEESKKSQEDNNLVKKRSRNCTKLTSSSGSLSKGEFRRDRKRKQNKDAATRYRQKKRKECIAVKDEESLLENRNQELKSKVQRLSNEISYLKGLLKEAKLRMQSTPDTEDNLLKGCSKILIQKSLYQKTLSKNKIFLMSLWK